MAKNEKTQPKRGRVAATISELKQVSWPAFPATMKKLGAVLLITAMFLVVLIGMDALLKWLYSALVMGVVGTWNAAAGYFATYNQDAEGSTSTIATTMYVGEMIAAAIVAAVLIAAAIVAIVIIKTRKKSDEIS